MKFISSLKTLEHVNAMEKAMRSAGLTVTRDDDAGTMVGEWQTRNGPVEIFRAIEKGEGQPWIVRHVENLFD